MNQKPIPKIPFELNNDTGSTTICAVRDLRKSYTYLLPFIAFYNVYLKKCARANFYMKWKLMGDRLLRIGTDAKKNELNWTKITTT